MTANTNFDSVLASTIYDKDGDKVGKVDQVYISEKTDEPRWVSVKTSLLGSSKSLVPLAGAKHAGDRLDVTVSKSAIKDAPHLDSDGRTSEAEEVALLRHYGFTEDNSGWNQYGKHAKTAKDAGAPTSGGQAANGADQRQTAGRRAAADAHDADSLVRSEERLNVGTEREVTGRARLRKYVVTEEQTVTVPVTHEEVEVVREPITDATSQHASIGEQDAEVTLHADRVVASKETVPVERVGLEVNEVTDQEQVSDTVRKERIETDGIGADRDKARK